MKNLNWDFIRHTKYMNAEEKKIIHANETLTNAAAPSATLRQPRVSDLYSAADNEPIIKNVLYLWERGEFTTWEQALITMVCMLAHSKQEVEKHAIIRPRADHPIRDM